MPAAALSLAVGVTEIVLGLNTESNRGIVMFVIGIVCVAFVAPALAMLGERRSSPDAGALIALTLYASYLLALVAWLAIAAVGFFAFVVQDYIGMD